MSRFSRFLALACCLVSAGVSADQVPATGKLLVATNEVRGPYFAQTVVLLLHHGETGTLGVVVNRPIDASAIEPLLLHEDLAAHRGTFYWGGPLSQSTVRALLRADTIPEDAVQIFDAVSRSFHPTITLHRQLTCQYHLARDFAAEVPNPKWVTDIRYIRIVGGVWGPGERGRTSICS